MICVTSQIERLREDLLSWGKQNTSEYPWRYTDNSYAVLVAEFMLHRTQARQVRPVYERFMSLFPTLSDFMKADLAVATDLLESLGLRWRIRGMIAALTELWNAYGEVPADLDKLMAVKGIGQYIASATVCFSGDRPVSLVDTNTVRVIGRVFGLDLRGEARRRKSVTNAIKQACSPDYPRDFYYALIDFAHTVCLPHDPRCSDCVLLSVPCSFGRERISKDSG